MSLNKPRIGNHIEYWYNKKWQKGIIINKTKQEVTIKLFISVLYPKIIYIDYPNSWKILTKEKKIIPAENKMFPSWIQPSQLIVVHQPKLVRHSQKITKIAKYLDGKYIILYYIEYPHNPFEPKKLKTINIDLSNKTRITPKNKYINFMDGDSRNIIYPYYNQIEMDIDYDMLSDLNNNILIQNLWNNKSNNNKHKSSAQQIIPKTQHDHSSYITNSTLQYGFILNHHLFPFDINRIILSFLAQKLIYVCPPTPCNELYDIPKSWQFNETTKLIYDLHEKTRFTGFDYKKYGKIPMPVPSGNYHVSVIGVEFQMNDNLTISGFELNNIDMLGLHHHKIYVNGYNIKQKIATQTQLHEHRRDAQFLFNDDELVKFRKYQRYTVKIVVTANVPCYQYHETPSNVKYFVPNNNNNIIYGWKCFTSIKWRKFVDLNKYTQKSCVLEWFPHFAFLLP